MRGEVTVPSPRWQVQSTTTVEATSLPLDLPTQRRSCGDMVAPCAADTLGACFGVVAAGEGGVTEKADGYGSSGDESVVVRRISAKSLCVR